MIKENNIKKYRIYGAPGTGKTTYMLNKINKIIDNGTPINRIMCLGYTNQTVNEFKTRFKQKLSINDEFKYFKTIHSICYQEEQKKNKVFDYNYYQYFKNFDKEQIEKYYFYYCLEREKYNKLDELLIYCENEYEEFCETYKKIKKDFGLIDFVDMLINFNTDFDIDYLFVDEAQDLTTNQWIVINKIIKNVKKEVYIILDPGQAIFQWAGGNVNWIENQNDYENIVLPKTFRLPKTIFNMALEILNDLNINKYNNLILENEKNGCIEEVFSLDDINFENEKEYLILVRNTFQYEKIINWGHENNFQIKIEQEPEFNENVIKKVYETYYNKKELTINLSKDEYNYIVENYILKKSPTINISTIHKAKGSECDNVILINSLTKKQFDELYVNDNTDELKVLYVAITRTKDKLWIVNQKGKKYYISNFL